MPFFNEAQLEASIIQLFLEQRYDYRPGETIIRLTSIASIKTQ